MRTLFRAALTLLPFLVACSSDTTGDNSSGGDGGGGGGGGGASTQQIDSCKQSCDKMKFFNCNSASEQARCYEDCKVATASKIELFTGCAENSVCDPACRTNIAPAESGGAGSGASAASCESACQKLVTCSFIKPADAAQCVTVCEKDAYQYQIDCVTGNECAKIKTTCGDPTGGGRSDEGSSGGDAP